MPVVSGRIIALRFNSRRNVLGGLPRAACGRFRLGRTYQPSGRRVKVALSRDFSPVVVLSNAILGALLHTMSHFHIGPRRPQTSRSHCAFCVLGAAIALTVTAVPLVLLAARAQVRATGASGPFTVAVNTSTIEAGPVYVLAAGPNGARVKVINGGVRDLANGRAQAATNAETQMLLASATNPKIRMLLTLAEGRYRIIGANRPASIRWPICAVSGSRPSHRPPRTITCSRC